MKVSAIDYASAPDKTFVTVMIKQRCGHTRKRVELYLGEEEFRDKMKFFEGLECVDCEMKRSERQHESKRVD